MSSVKLEVFGGGTRIPGAKTEYLHAAIAAPLVDQCTDVARDILENRGGNAVDAAIALLFNAGLHRMGLAGIGGGHVVTIYNKATRSVRVINARERAPLAATEDMFVGKPEQSLRGPLSIAVPAEVMGLWTAFTHFSSGKLTWRELIEPTIKMCRDGIPFNHAMDFWLNTPSDMCPKGHKFMSEAFRDRFYCKKDGTALQEGDLFVNEKLATTFERIADDPHSFYTGALAEDIVAELQAEGCIITLEDLKGCSTPIEDPISINLKDDKMTVYGAGPPASGHLVAFILNILDGYSINEGDAATPQKEALFIHRFVEALKFAYSKRTEFGDPDFVPSKELIEKLVSAEYGAMIRDTITDYTTHDIQYYDPKSYIPGNHGTLHISITDQYGNAVSVTSTLNLVWGSFIVGQRTGILYNNQMNDFSSPGSPDYFGLPPSPVNFICPGKRPMSSMAPTIVLDKNGDVVLNIGAAGGSGITSTTAYVILRNLWLGEELYKAMDSPRIHHQLFPNGYLTDPDFSKMLHDELKKKGHEHITDMLYFSIINAISSTKNGVLTVSDRRWNFYGGTNGF